MKIATYNVNSVNARMENLTAWLKTAEADAVLLQEIKCDDGNFPFFELRAAGYNRWWSLLILALISVVLGAVMLWNPFATVEVLVMAIGVILMVEGILNLAGSIWAAVQLKGLKKAARDMADQMQEMLGDPAFGSGDVLEGDWRDLDEKR